ncbi:hypothetical protein vseg_016600 [Gypsophila vaccaria]
MACTRTTTTILSFVIGALIFAQELQISVASRPSPPSTVFKVQATAKGNVSTVVQKAQSISQNVIRPPSLSIDFRVNRYKKIEIEAFRPTTPGRSPGAGHEEPPGPE